MNNENDVQRLEHIRRLVGDNFRPPRIRRITGNLFFTEPRRAGDAESWRRTTTVVTPTATGTNLSDLAGANDNNIASPHVDFSHRRGAIEVGRINCLSWLQPLFFLEARNIK